MVCLTLEINIIKALKELIIENENFDANQWCQDDADTLSMAARKIERGIDWLDKG